MSSISSIDLATLGITSQLFTTSENSGESSTTISGDDFLTLFLTELQNQDPLEPMDTYQMTEQICSMSQLEEQTKTNDYLVSLLQYQSSVNNSQALQMIGKEIVAEGNLLNVSDGSSETLIYELEDDTDSVVISIYDDNGELVRTITEENASAGEHSFTWNATDDDGRPLGDGTYTFEVAAYNSDGQSIQTTTYSAVEVASVEFRNGTAYLITENGEEIPYGSVNKVTQS